MAGKRQWQSGYHTFVRSLVTHTSIYKGDRILGLQRERWGGRVGRRNKEVGMTYAIPHRPCRHAPKPDLIQHEKLPAVPKARVKQVRRVRKPRRSTIRRVPLAEKRLQHIHHPAEEMRPTAHSRGPHGFQQRALGDVNLQEVMEAVVDDAVRVVDGEEVVPGEHLEHRFTEVEIDRAPALRAGAIPIKHQFLTNLLHRAFDSPRTHAMAVIINKVRESTLLVADFGSDEVGDRGAVSRQELVARGVVNGDSVARAELRDAGCGGAASRDEGRKVAGEPGGDAGVAGEEGDEGGVVGACGVEF